MGQLLAAACGDVGGIRNGTEVSVSGDAQLRKGSRQTDLLEGLIPNVKRDKNNRCVFDERDVAWISSLTCLKKCGMCIQEMKDYLALCLQGEETIPQRKEMLAQKQEALRQTMRELQESIAYIDWKQNFYDDALSGKRPYESNLLPITK